MYKMEVKLDHIGIVVKELEKAIRFYSEIFGWKQPETGPYSKILKVDLLGYKLRYVLLKANDCYVELIEPKEGPWLKRLEEGGEGSIWELCILVDDIKKFYDKIKQKGITSVDRFGKPLKEKYIVAPSGAKIMFLPRNKTFGTLIEVLERP